MSHSVVLQIDAGDLGDGLAAVYSEDGPELLERLSMALRPWRGRIQHEAGIADRFGIETCDSGQAAIDRARNATVLTWYCTNVALRARPVTTVRVGTRYGGGMHARRQRAALSAAVLLLSFGCQRDPVAIANPLSALGPDAETRSTTQAITQGSIIDLGTLGGPIATPTP